MKRLIPLVLVFAVFSFSGWSDEIDSLSQILLTGKGIKDTDKDTFADKISLCMIIPDNPNPYEIALASDIAARVNLESLVVDLFLVKKESETREKMPSIFPVLIGRQTKWAKRLERQSILDTSSLSEHQGFVTVFKDKGQTGIAVVGGSPETLLRTGRAFFLRWPYLWDIWGREEGATYLTFEEDLATFFKDAGVRFERALIQTVLYEFPPTDSPHESLQRLRFNHGEIKTMRVRIDFPNSEQKELALHTLEELKSHHQKGLRTHILTYAGCAQISFELRSGSQHSEFCLHRVGYPKRLLTPSYKSVTRPKIEGKDYDLLSMFSTKGFYSDINGDKIQDKIDSKIIIPQETSIEGVSALASKLVLFSAGGSFPLLYLDKEIEDEKGLISPILIGSTNTLYKSLIKIGKLKPPPLLPGQGMATIIPKAFNPSNALVVMGSDREGLEKILAYLSQTYPYLDEYGEGHSEIHEIPGVVEEFLTGKYGSAEAYFKHQMDSIIIEDIKDKDLEFFRAKLYLHQENKKYESALEKQLKETLSADSFEIKSYKLQDGKNVFLKEKQFPWEGEEALNLIGRQISRVSGSSEPVKIHLRVSESPEVRRQLTHRIEDILDRSGISSFEVEVLSSYKQGFFWLTEKVIPELRKKKIDRITIRFSEEKDDFSKPKRFYADPYRWLQELYPVDEIIAKDAGIPIENITFEKKEEGHPIYEVLAYGGGGACLFTDSFSPKIIESLYLNVLPEWGTVRRTTGWLKIEQGTQPILDTALKSDLEHFWDYYQEEILPEVYSYILEKTGNEPSFKKQPYFKRLLIEMWFSEPDYLLGLDQEIISSLEAIHDEVYFDTLDFLRGITDVELDERETQEDTSRYSAPGNVLPLIHPSSEGKPGRVKVQFDGWQAKTPQIILQWKEREKREHTKTLTFPELKIKELRIPELTYDGKNAEIANILVSFEIEKESDYLSIIEIIHAYRELLEKDRLASSIYFPGLSTLTWRIKHKELVKDESFPVKPIEVTSLPSDPEQFPGEAFVPTDKIISPEMCLDIVSKLSRHKTIKAYFAGESYEKRKIPVLEVYTPLEKYVSLPRLITFKPTLYLSGRQHANEVSATNYILKFAELLATDSTYQEYLKKMNFVLHPLENPDGAALAYELQKITPHHSLHAGRYTSLGIDVGYQVNASKPLLPEAKVRKNLWEKWLPDIHLNLHGYPSHEWVQQFSNYSPYLFRDYWIPRGWFAYFRSVTLPIFKDWKKAGEDLRASIIKEFAANEKIQASNKKFYDRYYRWAARWQPHMNYLEIYDGVNLYAKRRSSRESRLSSRRRITVVEETPELMDETAHGAWLNFLSDQGLSYLQAHVNYLTQAQHEIARIEEEIQGRIHIQFVRRRPGETENK
ncbi:MAG: M14 family zinc carboxypeptidase [Candidatus Aminicenantaceae bacterium]